ncbi:DegT/DnrJ/EryC1/StrS family aminotransferase [Fusobacterium sp. THCT1E2]
MMKVPFSILERQYKKYQGEYEEKALAILRKGWYILGEETETFEKNFSKYIGTKYSLGIDNGLNALVLAFRALDIKNGDEVIVQSNTFIATVMAITMNGATPIFVEPDKYYNIDVDKIEEKITSKTKAICVVHLYGQATNMKKVLELCKKYNLKLVEDCAQAHGAEYNGKKVGSFGDIGCFSFYPGKNLGCFGDGGAITTNNEEIYKRIKLLRSYGSEKKYHHVEVGYNARLDELQAGLLSVKLSHLGELNSERENIMERYLAEIKNPLLILPEINKECTHVWHLFVVRVENREKFEKYLEENGIGTVIHYPIPPHLSKAYEYLGYKKGDFPIAERYAETVISLPIYNGMIKEEIDYVIEKINKYS